MLSVSVERCETTTHTHRVGTHCRDVEQSGGSHRIDTPGQWASASLSHVVFTDNQNYWPVEYYSYKTVGWVIVDGWTDSSHC